MGLAPQAVRGACRCAACVDEATGAQVLDVRAVSPTIVPRAVVEMGNYGFAIEWSDGHTSSIYTKAQLKDMAVQAGRRPRV